MNIVIAGGSGFLGTALRATLIGRGDAVRVLTRRPSAPEHVAWSPADPAGPWVDTVAQADAVVNLAGEPIDKGRWTERRKRALVESRLTATRAIVAALSRSRGDGVLISASAVGFYGSCGDERLSEESAPGDDFLATLCLAWEREALEAERYRRVVRLRTGLVLDRHKGALRPLLTPFALGIGGRLGSGRQYWSWIHRDDWVRLALFAIDESRVSGAINLTAPGPVTNGAFAKTLGRVLHRPAVIPAPAFALRILLGETADAMVMSGQRVLPSRALALGFEFRFTGLESALEDLLR